MAKDDKNANLEDRSASLSRRDLAGRAAGVAAAMAVGAGALSTASAAAGFHGLDRGRAIHTSSINATDMKLGELRAAAARETDPGKSAIYRAALEQVASGGGGDEDKFNLMFGLKMRSASD